jgi:hypothetical protein
MNPQYKDVYTHFKKLEKSLKEIQAVEDKYLSVLHHIKPDSTGGKVELTHEQLQLLYSAYNDFYYVLRQSGSYVIEPTVSRHTHTYTTSRRPNTPIHAGLINELLLNVFNELFWIRHF